MITLSAFFKNPWTGQIIGASTLFDGNGSGDNPNSGGAFQFQTLDMTLNKAQSSAVAKIVSLAGQLQAIKDGTAGADGAADASADTSDSATDEGASRTASNSGLEHMFGEENGEFAAWMPGVGFVWASPEEHTFGGGGRDHINSSGFISHNIAAGGGADTINVAAHEVFSIYGDSVAGMDPDTITADGNDIINIAGDDVFCVYGGGGNDLINITGNWLANCIYGGAGNDVMNINSRSAGRITGGTGDDTITFLSPPGAEFLDFAKGDGHDVYNINGYTAVDFLGGLTVKDVVTSAKDKTITISFNESGDSITINYANVPFEGEEPQLSLEESSDHNRVGCQRLVVAWSVSPWE